MAFMKRQWLGVQKANKWKSLLLIFFHSLYTSQGSSYFNDILNCINHVVCNSMSGSLIVDFTKEKLHVVIKQMPSLKKLGPDGIPTL